MDSIFCPPARAADADDPEGRPRRAHHEAGHAVAALLVGIRVEEVYASEGTSLTRYEDESYEAANPRDQILVALAGGVAEEIVFGDRRRIA